MCYGHNGLKGYPLSNDERDQATNDVLSAILRGAGFTTHISNEVTTEGDEISFSICNFNSKFSAIATGTNERTWCPYLPDEVIRLG